MVRLVFLESSDGSMAIMASALARRHKMTDVEVVGVTLGKEGEPHPILMELLKKEGFDGIHVRCCQISELYVMPAQVVIALTAEAWKSCPLLPGRPALINWSLEFPCLSKTEEENLAGCFREMMGRIKGLVDDFFSRGYLAALTDMEGCADLVLESISDGIIAHDLQRRIIYFNRAAEEITGYSRGEVLGRDCHEAFPGKFCGGKCKFCGVPQPLPGVVHEEVVISTRDGERRDIAMTLTPINDALGRPAGVLASFKDITRQHELERRAEVVTHFSGIVGRDRRMLELYDLIRDLAENNAPVLITGESGTGKEMVAAAIHNEGPRAAKQFVPVNCGALPETLLESELFGHVRGAFTGAVRDKKGRFELADGGTIFLDEIGDISPAMQVRLMRVLQEGTFERVGSEQTIKVDVRVISATNKDLQKEIAAGRFREDLYYRLAVVPIHIPPLRERKTDIPLLIDHILKKLLADSNRQGITISPEVLDVMMTYEWPGNVRELQNWLQFALIKCKGTMIKPEHLPKASSLFTIPKYSLESSPVVPRRRHLDEAMVKEALVRTGGNRVEAARLLGISRATLYRLLPKLKNEAGT